MKDKPNGWPAVQAALLLVALALPTVLPPLASWPWYFLGPLLLYAVVVAVIPPLRRSVGWLKIGRMNALDLAVIAPRRLYFTTGSFTPICAS